MISPDGSISWKWEKSIKSQHLLNTFPQCGWMVASVHSTHTFRRLSRSHLIQYHHKRVNCVEINPADYGNWNACAKKKNEKSIEGFCYWGSSRKTSSVSIFPFSITEQAHWKGMWPCRMYQSNLPIHYSIWKQIFAFIFVTHRQQSSWIVFRHIIRYGAGAPIDDQ